MGKTEEADAENRRKHRLTKEDVREVQESMDDAETYESILDSGIVGITQGRADDVKCLHAQVADHLARGNNPIGEEVLRELESRGVDPQGSNICNEQCDPNIENTAYTWRYRSIKNKSRLTTRRDNRRRGKLAQANKAAVLVASTATTIPNATGMMYIPPVEKNVTEAL